MHKLSTKEERLLIVEASIKRLDQRIATATHQTELYMLLVQRGIQVARKEEILKESAP